ncbi:hypothetical protein FACS1894132_12750 [Clostridia bacterium]|nr:hypothetical protein FACS1894132_12750 [Clostridia bacterium]
MSIRDIKINAKEKLRGKYLEALSILFSFGFVYVSLWFLEFFSGGSSILFLVLNFLLLTPLLIGAIWWLSKTTEKKYFVENVDFFKIITNIPVLLRGFLIVLLVLVIQTLFFAVIVALIYGAYYIFEKAQTSNNTVLMLLISLNLLFFAFLVFCKQIKTLFALSALPVLFTRSPFENPISLIINSFEIMNGHKLNLLILLLSYWWAIPLLPFFMPKIIGGVLVFIHDIST